MFRKAAAQGDALSQEKVADRYRRGSGGLPKSYEEAASWYLKAANQGAATAQYSLAEMYLRGEGIARDPAAAEAWYRKAADQGLSMAQVALARMYTVGDGVEKNLPEAYFWLTLSVASGSSDQVERRDLLEKSLSPAEVHAAQRRAIQWELQRNTR
jgi:TPR repeat protein